LKVKYYNINGGITNYTFTDFNGFLNQTAWDIKENGLITIR